MIWWASYIFNTYIKFKMKTDSCATWYMPQVPLDMCHSYATSYTHNHIFANTEPGISNNSLITEGWPFSILITLFNLTRSWMQI